MAGKCPSSALALGRSPVTLSFSSSFAINGMSPGDLLTHRVSGYYTSSQSSVADHKYGVTAGANNVELADERRYYSGSGSHSLQVEGCTSLSKPGEVTQAVKDAIACGYRHLDCAYAYGNEREVGAGIKAKIEDGTIKREDLFVTSKLWNTFHSKALVVPTLKESLTNLGLDYLDLYLIHWPMGYKEGAGDFPKDENGKFLYADVDYLETWSGLEELVDLGLVRSIGISNFNADQIQRICDNCRTRPAVHQIECHPYLNQRKMIDFCRSKGIYVTAYSPLGSPDRPWAKPGDPLLMEDPKIVAIAEKYKKTPAQVLIRYQIQQDVIVIPKSVTKSRIESNIQVFDFTLSDEDMKTIDSFHCNGRVLHLDWVKDHKYYPFHTEF